MTAPDPVFRHLGDRRVHQGHIWHVAVGTYEAPDGERFERDIVRSPGAVGVVPLIVENGVPIVVCVRQYRPVLDQWVLEIPAGMRDVPGEALELTASRELAEEAGLIAGRLHHLTDFFPSAGMTDSVLHLYLATELRQSERDLHGPEESHMEVVRLTLDDAVQQVLSGDIKDAKTVIGVLLVDRRWREGTIDAAAGG